MGLVAAKCTQCGAAIEVDATKESGICKYCGTPFITEKVINNYTYNNSYNIENIENAIIQSGPSEANLLKRADDFLFKNELDNARDYYNKVLDLNIDNIKAKLGIINVNIIELERNETPNIEELIKLYKEYVSIDNNDSAKKQKLYFLLMLKSCITNNETDVRNNAKLLFSELFNENPDDPFLNKYLGKYYVGMKVISYFKVKKISEICELDRYVEHNKINVVNYLVNECGLDYYQAHYFINNISYNDITVYNKPQNIPAKRPSSFPPITKSKGFFGHVKEAAKKGDNITVAIWIVLSPLALVKFLIELLCNVIGAVFSPIKTIKKILGVANSNICYMCEETVSKKSENIILTHDEYAFHKKCISLIGIDFSEKFINETDLAEIVYIIKMFYPEINKDSLKNYYDFKNKTGLLDE